jgi:hypothetical protein
MSAAFNPFEGHMGKPEPAQAQPIAETTESSPAKPEPAQTQPIVETEEQSPASAEPIVKAKPSPATRANKAVNPFARYAAEPKARPEYERARRLPAQELLAWIQHGWRRPTISLRDICTYGPVAIRTREAATTQAETLEKHGWLVELQAHRYDRRVWRTPPAGATLPD